MSQHHTHQSFAMKTTALLCALATIATAVPANHHETLPQQEALGTIPVNIQREKKSPLHDHHAAGLSSEAGTEDVQTQSTKSEHKISSMEGRSLGFNKPIIVKKKLGYHVYRDSDEEMAHADPHEHCSQQVKVKLCDDETGTSKSNCLTSERLKEHISDKEIENSIKTAKEAVENLQRGFHKLEHNSVKLATIENKELEDDLAVHQHIEAARKALEHVQRNFEHLDTMNLQATSPKTEDFQSKDEERLAQWKDAIDNIQKNFEIARNIEDAFKADSEQVNLHFTQKDDLSKIRESEHIEPNVDSQDKSNPDHLSNVASKELRSDESDALIKPGENSDVDMFTAPTQQKELTVKLHSDSLRSEKNTEDLLDDHETKKTNTEKLNEHITMMKNSEMTSLSDGFTISGHVNNQQLKAANGINLDGDEKLKTSESNTHFTKFQTEKDAMPEMENMTPLIKDMSVNEDNSLAKSVHMESVDLTTKQHEHDMSMEATDVAKHHSHMEMKHSDNHELEKNPHKEDSIVAMSLTHENPLDKSQKSKSVHEVDEHHREENVKSTDSNHKFHERMNEGVPTQENIKHTESTPIRETGLNNEHQNHNDHSTMRMTEDQNMEHKSKEMHTLHEHPNMRMTEEEKYHAFLMRWANENQQKLQESDITGPTQLSEFHNGQHFHDVGSNMRLNQDQNTDHHLSENHEQDPSVMHWAQEKQQNPLQVAKTATDFHDTMMMNNHQNMQNHVTDDRNLHEHFLMRLAQEKQLKEHLKTTPEINNGHLHEMFPQNRFANNLANVHDMSQVGPRMNDHLHIMKHAMTSDMDSSMQPSMHMSMRDSIGKPTMEHNDMHWNHHHHAMARYGSGLPVTSASSGAVGLFPNANTGGCGIPLMLSCSPNVISGTLAKTQPHPGSITAPAYRSGDDMMFYMKRDAKDTDELPTLKIQKMSIPFNHKPELVFDKTQ